MKIVAQKIAGPRLYKTSRGLVPSVTTVLSILEKRHFDSWRRRVGHQEADRATRTAQVFGTKVHAVAQSVAKDRKFKPLGDAADLQPFADAVRDFLNIHIMDVLETEMELTSERLGFGGTLDLYGQMYDGSYVVVDYKTTKNGLTREHGLQTAAYAMLLREHGYTVNKRIVVRVKQEDPGKHYARSYADHAGDIKAFKGCVDVWWWAHRNKMLKAMELAS